MTTTTLAIPAGEWSRVDFLLSEFGHHDEFRSSGHARCSIRDGRRSWVVADHRAIAILEVAADPTMSVEIHLSSRLIDAAVAMSKGSHSVDLIVDSEQPQLLTLTSPQGTVTLPSFVGNFVDWRTTLGEARLGTLTTCVVDRDSAKVILGEGRRPPHGVCLASVNPPFWLECADGSITASVDWPEIGPSRFTVFSQGGASARVRVSPRALAHALAACTPGPVAVSFPADPTGAMMLTDTTGLTALTFHMDPEADRHRPVLESAIVEAFGPESLYCNLEGDYVLPVETAPSFARVSADDEVHMKVYSVAVSGIPRSEELLVELNEQNSRLPKARAVWVADQVIFESDHDLDELDGSGLIEFSHRVAGLAAELGPVLALSFGGLARGSEESPAGHRPAEDGETGDDEGGNSEGGAVPPSDG